MSDKGTMVPVRNLPRFLAPLLFVDEKQVARLSNQGDATIELASGTHTAYVRLGMYRSTTMSFEVQANGPMTFTCLIPLPWKVLFGITFIGLTVQLALFFLVPDFDLIPPFASAVFLAMLIYGLCPGAALRLVVPGTTMTEPGAKTQKTAAGEELKEGTKGSES